MYGFHKVMSVESGGLKVTKSRNMTLLILMFMHVCSGLVVVRTHRFCILAPMHCTVQRFFRVLCLYAIGNVVSPVFIENDS